MRSDGAGVENCITAPSRFACPDEGHAPPATLPHPSGAILSVPRFRVQVDLVSPEYSSRKMTPVRVFFRRNRLFLRNIRCDRSSNVQRGCKEFHHVEDNRSAPFFAGIRKEAA